MRIQLFIVTQNITVSLVNKSLILVRYSDVRDQLNPMARLKWWSKTSNIPYANFLRKPNHYNSNWTFILHHLIFRSKPHHNSHNTIEGCPEMPHCYHDTYMPIKIKKSIIACFRIELCSRWLAYCCVFNWIQYRKCFKCWCCRLCKYNTKNNNFSNQINCYNLILNINIIFLTWEFI